jgi:flavorubredoxin
MIRQLKPNVLSVGAIDWDRRLFDALIPLPDGTTYNAYLVRGSEKTALLDTVDPSMADTLVDNLVDAGVDRLDYVIAHHAEQDHSGAIPDLLAIHPEAKVVTNPKCGQMLIDLLDIDPDAFLTVEDGGEITLGDKTLRFVYIPWVHWPETMGTYLVEDAVFFPCDFLGAHLAAGGLFAEDEAALYESAKRYYAEIMMPFRTPVRKNLEKISNLKIDMIAPSHGPVHGRPSFIIDAYSGWASDEVKNEAVIAYVSMHGSTKKMADHLTGCLIERGVKVRRFDLTATDPGKLAIALVDAATVVIGSGTVLAGPHPAAANACVLANALRPKTRFASVLASYGWAGRCAEQIAQLLPNLKVEMIEPVTVKGSPKAADLEAIEGLAEKIFTKHRELGITR